MFNAFGSKKQPEKKPEVKEVNLQDTNDRVIYIANISQEIALATLN